MDKRIKRMAIYSLFGLSLDIVAQEIHADTFTDGHCERLPAHEAKLASCSIQHDISADISKAKQ